MIDERYNTRLPVFRPRRRAFDVPRVGRRDSKASGTTLARSATFGSRKSHHVHARGKFLAASRAPRVCEVQSRPEIGSRSIKIYPPVYLRTSQFGTQVRQFAYI